jgi:hypothetical protein
LIVPLQLLMVPSKLQPRTQKQLKWRNPCLPPNNLPLLPLHLQQLQLLRQSNKK